MEKFTYPYSIYPIKLRQHILHEYIFLELRVRIRVMRSCCHTSVTSDDTVTGTVISYKTYERMTSYNVYNTY